MKNDAHRPCFIDQSLKWVWQYGSNNKGRAFRSLTLWTPWQSRGKGFKPRSQGEADVELLRQPQSLTRNLQKMIWKSRRFVGCSSGSKFKGGCQDTTVVAPSNVDFHPGPEVVVLVFKVAPAHDVLELLFC